MASRARIPRRPHEYLGGTWALVALTTLAHASAAAAVDVAYIADLLSGTVSVVNAFRAAVRYSAMASRSLHFEILQPHTTPGTQAGAGPGDPTQEARIVLDTVRGPRSAPKDVAVVRGF